MFSSGEHLFSERVPEYHLWDVPGRNWGDSMKSLMWTLVCGVVFQLCGSHAFAQAPPSSLNEAGVQGPITGINPTARTITVGGMVCEIPPDLIIDGTTGITGATLSRLLDTAAPGRVRSIFQSGLGEAPYSAATLTAEGLTLVEGTTTRHVMSAAMVDFGENSIIGNVSSYNATTGSFVVNGVTCRMNPDQRFPAVVLSVAGTPMPASNLSRSVNTPVLAAGYFHQGVLYATSVETELVPLTPGADTVQVIRATARLRGNALGELRIDGVVQPFAANAVVTVSDSASGTVLGTAAVTQSLTIPGQGEFSFRLRSLGRRVTSVRVQSSGRGETTATLTIR